MRLDHVGFEVDDWCHSVSMLVSVLGMEMELTKRVESDPARLGCRIAFLRAGHMRLELIERPATDGPKGCQMRFDHLGFVSADPHGDAANLLACGLSVRRLSPVSDGDSSYLRVTINEQLICEFMRLT